MVKRAKLPPAAFMTAQALVAELGQRGLDSTGNTPELVARLTEDRKKDAGCRWIGCVGELVAHLEECEWVQTNCPHEGCTASPLRMDMLKHQATCEHRKVPCGHCASGVAYWSLAEHEECICPEAMIKCPNEGCSVQKLRGDG
jgi:hypothetical protein